jgi:hypothetical protein
MVQERQTSQRSYSSKYPSDSQRRRSPSPRPATRIQLPVPRHSSPTKNSPTREHQYNTRLRRILSACRIFGYTNSKAHSNLKTISSVPLSPYPDSNPNSTQPHHNSDSDPNSNPNPDPDTNSDPDFSETLQTLNLDIHGKPLSYSTSKSSPDRHLWTLAEAEEILGLILSGTLVPIAYSDIPLDRLRDIVYYNPVVKQKWNDDGTIKYRVRGTAGGNLLDVPYDVSARTASLDVVKILLHSTVSDKKQWFTIDIKDFYLGTPLPDTRYEYIRIACPQETTAYFYRRTQPGTFLLQRRCLFSDSKMYVRTPTSWHRLSQLRLILHLAKHGYHQCPNTPCLFQHETRDITFCLVVDDFGVRYNSQSDADHLIATLRANQYDLTI